MELYLHGNSVATTGWKNSFWSQKVEHKVTDVPRSGQTRTGYGKAIPTQYMVRFNGKWRRVYCAIFSNVGTLYLNTRNKDEEIFVREHD